MFVLDFGCHTMNRLALLTCIAIAAAPVFARAQSAFGQADADFKAVAPADMCDLEAAVGPDDSVFQALFSSSASGWALGKFNADGSLDTRWGESGVVKTPSISRMIPLPSGAVIVATGGKLTRYDARGALDPTFGTAGTSDAISASSSGYLNSMSVQPDGSIVVLGDGNNDPYVIAPNHLAMTRILPNGHRDASFGNGGFVAITVPNGATVYAWSLLSDGSLELGYTTADAMGSIRPELHRYPTDFEEPPARVMPHVGIADWMAPTVGIAGDGAAVFATAFGTYPTTSPQIALTRFSPGGALDPSFGTNGRATIAVHGMYSSDPSGASPKMLWQDADGSWTVLTDIGQSQDGWAMIDTYYSTLAVRFRADGAPDAQFPQGKDLGGGQLTKFVQLQTGELIHAESTSAGCSLVKQAADSPRADAQMIEYYQPSLDHYFMTLEGAESRLLDSQVATMGWQRTGRTFGAWLPVGVPGTTSLCRFYGDPVIGPNSHFYTPAGPECDFLVALAAGTPPGKPAWHLEGLAAAVTVPAGGECPGNLTPIDRAYNDGFAHGRDPNHRYTADAALYAQMQAQGWVGEGVAFCVPLPTSRGSLF